MAGKGSPPSVPATVKFWRRRGPLGWERSALHSSLGNTVEHAPPRELVVQLIFSVRGFFKRAECRKRHTALRARGDVFGMYLFGIRLVSTYRPLPPPFTLRGGH
ncbi:hypothetical protein [Crucivirus-432]|nr:hypothetical protein [Crucivirus-432]